MSKKLYKSATDRKLFGVCGGVAEYFDIDSTLVRLLFTGCIVFGGLSVIWYILCAIILPDKA